MNDPELLALFSEDDWLQQLARSLARDPDHADELVQETWLAALRSEVAPQSPRAWLRTVLTNFARRSYRSEGRQLRREREAARPETSSVEEPDWITDEVRHRVREALAGLPVRHSNVLVDRYFLDQTPSEIARSRGLPLDTVKSRLRVARRQLARAVEAGDPRRRQDWLGSLLAGFRYRAAGVALFAVGAVALAGTFVLPWPEDAPRSPVGSSPAGPDSLARSAVLVPSISPTPDVEHRVSIQLRVLDDMFGQLRDAPASLTLDLGEEQRTVRGRVGGLEAVLPDLATDAWVRDLRIAGQPAYAYPAQVSLEGSRLEISVVRLTPDRQVVVAGSDASGSALPDEIWLAMGDPIAGHPPGPDPRIVARGAPPLAIPEVAAGQTWVGAPGHAWSSLALSHGSAGETYEVTLEPGGSIDVAVRPFHPEDRLFLRVESVAGDLWTMVEAREDLRIEGVPEGEYRVQLVPRADATRHLDASNLEVRAGRTGRVTLGWPGRYVAATERVLGRLEVDDALWDASPVAVVQSVEEDGRLSPPDPERVLLRDEIGEDGSFELWLEPGRHRLSVGGVPLVPDLIADGRLVPTLLRPEELVPVTVRTTGSPVSLLSWVAGDPGVGNFAAGTLVRRAAGDECFTFEAPVGEILIAGVDARGHVRAFIEPGIVELELALEPWVGLELTVECEGHVIPVDLDCVRLEREGLERGDGTPVPVQARGRVIPLPGPGDYRIWLPEAETPRGFRAVGPVEVTLEAGFRRVRLPLARD